MKKEKHALAWHFLPSDRKLTNGDRRLVVAGETLTVECEPVLCHSGLHASVDILHALSYNRGPVLCRVEVSGNVQHGDDKICGKSRKCLAIEDISSSLMIWALDCAEHVLEIYEKRNPGDNRVRDCINAGRAYLRGEITREALLNARKASASASASAAASASASATASAASATAFSAYATAFSAYAISAAADAAYAAADAAYAAADAAADAAYAAADAAADAADAARSKERDWQRNRLIELLPDSLRSLA